MKHVKSSHMMLLLLVSAACTTTTEGSPADAPSAPPRTGGTIVFNRVTPEEGWAVYRLDLGTGDELQIRENEDGVILSPDGSRFLGAWPIPDGRIGPATFDVDGSGYSLLPIDDPTLQVGGGAWSPDGSRLVSGAWDDTDPSRVGLYTFRSTDGGGLVRLTAPANPSHDYGVGYSPDGSKVLFIREVKPYDHSGPMDVFVVRDGRFGRRPTERARGPRAAWRPKAGPRMAGRWRSSRPEGSGPGRRERHVRRRRRRRDRTTDHTVGRQPEGRVVTGRELDRVRHVAVCIRATLTCSSCTPTAPSARTSPRTEQDSPGRRCGRPIARGCCSSGSGRWRATRTCGP